MYYVYILTNKYNTTLYIGVTNNLERRVFEHREGLLSGFTKKYKVHKLVYYEDTDDIGAAIAREKQLKNWHREWKFNLIRQENAAFNDLAAGSFGKES
jgi:putative endonuclease